MKSNEIRFETYKKTRNLAKAEQNRRLYNWEVSVLVDYLKRGRIDDAYDLLFAGLLVMQNKTTDKERQLIHNMLTDIGRQGFETEEKELRWRLQKYLKLEGEE